MFEILLFYTTLCLIIGILKAVYLDDNRNKFLWSARWLLIPPTIINGIMLIIVLLWSSSAVVD